MAKKIKQCMENCIHIRTFYCVELRKQLVTAEAQECCKKCKSFQER